MFEQRDLSFIHKYFIAEKQESLLFLIVGIVAVLLAFIFYFFLKSNPTLFKGLAVPLLVIGLIQTVVGYTVFTRSDKQKNDVAYNIGMEPTSYTKHTELPRMEKVMKNFVVYRWVEIVFVIIGIVLIFLFRLNPDRIFWYGFGITLAIQGAILLGADYFAEKRGGVYTEQIRKLVSE